MLTSFTVCGIPTHVYITEDEALVNVSTEAFVISLEDIYVGLHCDNFSTCNACPISEECDTYEDHLPHYLVTTYAPEFISQYPEYFI